MFLPVIDTSLEHLFSYFLWWPTVCSSLHMTVVLKFVFYRENENII